MERIAFNVSPELKASLRAQAQRAGVPLAEWIRTRLELEGTDPDEMRAFLAELAKLRARAERNAAAMDAQRAEREAREREVPARLAAMVRQGREIAEQLIATGRIREFAEAVAQRGKS